MDPLAWSILCLLANDIETVCLITRTLNCEPREGYSDPRFDHHSTVDDREVQRWLDYFQEDGLVRVYQLEDDNSLPELHGPWYGLTDKGWEAIGEQPKSYLGFEGNPS